jgi:hypothetical protein
MNKCPNCGHIIRLSSRHECSREPKKFDVEVVNIADFINTEPQSNHSEHSISHAIPNLDCQESASVNISDSCGITDF